MAKWDHDDLLSKHDDLIAHYYNRWKDASMPAPKKKAPRPILQYNAPIPEEDFGDELLLEMLDVRMRWGYGDRTCPFKTIVTTKINADTVATFVVTNNDAIIIRDELGLFPSDALVTQLRLLSGAK